MPVSATPACFTSSKSFSFARIHVVISGNFNPRSWQALSAARSLSLYRKNSLWRTMPFGPPRRDMSLNRSTICCTVKGEVDCCPSRKVVSVIQISAGISMGTWR